ncbi:MAG TPA: hypothetical protein PLY82_00555 [Methanosarcina thermophila]|uniref:LIM zinc-binding domain-containing protein n=3 Tax=Methanosarcina thermophila TaxID=2210 RepID=A0A0E3NFX0_METTE|nr:hypothetical protein MSTHT_1470 [Methanosarcina thermophila TM-1]AKB16137.1 hypothetical protein MSTHC_1819 [Methanosarcina thermophila CHTI-55]BAW28220.1 conserved hypothetical protein [Methanosarcina thermophila]HOQ64434.1 hypothetical protein [Methanosarcina thermophila]
MIAGFEFCYLEFHGLVKTDKSDNRELNKNISYFITCPACRKEIPGVEYIKVNGRMICEDCYLEEQQRIKFADPVAVCSKKLFRKMHGLEGIEGLTELQKAIYEFIISSGGAKKEEVAKKFGISLLETENQFALLRHCELVKGQKRADYIYLVPLDALISSETTLFLFRTCSLNLQKEDSYISQVSKLM